MFDNELQSETAAGDGGLARVRADSQVRAVLAADQGRTFLARLYESGSFRLRFPRAPACQAVLINTGGGITGGDRLDVRLAVGPQADVVVTSQAAEKLYRSDGAVASVAMRGELAAGARLAWLPQETILFDGANVERRLEVDMAQSACLTAVEMLAFGRPAYGERIADARWRDNWRVRRGGKLVLAETVRLDGPLFEAMQRPAVGAGARAIATLAHIAPDGERHRDAVRSALAGATSCWGCSAWNGMLVARFAADELHRLRADVAAAVMVITGTSMPRAWSC